MKCGVGCGRWWYSRGTTGLHNFRWEKSRPPFLDSTGSACSENLWPSRKHRCVLAQSLGLIVFAEQNRTDFYKWLMRATYVRACDVCEREWGCMWCGGWGCVDMNEGCVWMGLRRSMGGVECVSCVWIVGLIAVDCVWVWWRWGVGGLFHKTCHGEQTILWDSIQSLDKFTFARRPRIIKRAFRQSNGVFGFKTHS